MTSHSALPFALAVEAAAAAAWQLAEWHVRHGPHGRLRVREAPLDQAVIVTAARRVGVPDHDFVGLAPEQTGPWPHPVDERTDLYAFGVLLYQMLTARQPFQAATERDWAREQWHGVPPAPSTLIPGLPRIIDEIIARVLAREPDQRYQTARGLAVDLSRLHENSDLVESGGPQAGWFPIASRDVSEHLTVGVRLIGRESRFARLISMLDRVRQDGRPLLTRVAGDAGVGKSAMLARFADELAASGHLVAVARAGDRSTPRPYATLADLTASLARCLAGDRDDWRTLLTETLGPARTALAELSPVWGDLVAAQERHHRAGHKATDRPADRLPMEQRRQQLAFAVRGLLAVVTSGGRPLTLLIDDLDAADEATIRVLGDLMGEPVPLLIVAAYRSKRLAGSPGLRALLDQPETRGRLGGVDLRPLADSAMTELVAATLRRPAAEVSPLALQIARGTSANPLAAELVLLRLHAHHKLVFDPHQAGWVWSADRLTPAEAGGDLDDLADERVRGLSGQASEVARTAAILGGPFDVEVLARASGIRPAELVAPMRTLVREQLLEIDSGAGLERRYRWAHSALRDALLAQLPADDLAELRLTAAQALLAEGSHAEPDTSYVADLIFALLADVSRLDERLGPADRTRLAELHLAAGRRAARLGAALVAYRHLHAGTERLPASAWKKRYELAMTLYIEAARAAREQGESAVEAADALVDTAYAMARSDVDRAELLRTKLASAQRPYFDEATLSAGLQALALLGLPTPEDSDGRRAAADSAVLAAWTRLAARTRIGDRRPEDLAAPEPMTDRRARLASGLIAELLPAVAPDVDTRALLATAGVELAFEHGPSESSATAFAWLGAVLADRFGDHDLARWCAEMALELAARMPESPEAAAAKATVATTLPFLAGPVEATPALLAGAHMTALAYGDHYGATITQLLLYAHQLAIGAPLDQLSNTLVESARLLARPPVCPPALQLGDAMVDAVDRLRTVGPSPQAAAGPPDEVTAGLEWLSRLQLTTEMMTAYLLGDHGMAVEYGEAAERIAPVHWADIVENERVFYQALAIAAQYPTASELQQRIWTDKLATLQEQLERWAAYRPAGFAHRALVVSAERARLAGHIEQALGRYERAIGGARENGFLHVQAIAAELGGLCLLQHGEPGEAVAYLRRAQRCYTRWGAHAKVEQLDRLLGTRLDGQVPARPVDQLDLLTVVKAFSAISSVLELDKLTATLLELLVQQAGAQRGCLLLDEGGELRLAATATNDSDLVTVTRTPPGSLAEHLPRTLVEHTARTGDPVLGDADALGFADDPYLRAHRPRALLAAPIAYHGRRIGVLYLEHRHRADAFSPGQLDLLEVLCGQAAICLDNARMYASLAEANRILDATFDGLPVGLIVLRPDLTVHRASPFAAELMGLPIRPGTPLVDLVDVLTPTDVDGRPLRMEPGFAAIGPEPTGRIYNQVQIVRPDGHRQHLDTWAIPLRNADGQMLGVTLLVREPIEGDDPLAM